MPKLMQCLKCDAKVGITENQQQPQCPYCGGHRFIPAPPPDDGDPMIV